MKTRAQSLPPRRANRAAMILATIVGAVAIFAIGRWTAGDGARPADDRRSSPRPGPVLSDAAWPIVPTRPAVPHPPPAAHAPQPAAPVAAPSSTGEVVALATSNARTQLETLRPEILSHCAEASGPERGRGPAKVTFHVTFDANGREIARGISEDRTAPTGTLARCLRTLPIGSLSIPPPGTRVAVRVAMAFP
jgi:hypothetical protein